MPIALRGVITGGGIRSHGAGWRAWPRDLVTGRPTAVATGCEAECEAEAAGWKYLNDITEGTWRDPKRGRMPLRTYIYQRWWPSAAPGPEHQGTVPFR